MEEILSKEEYFDSWNQEDLTNISEEHKDIIYNRHKLRKTVFKRDNEKCQIEGCEFGKSDITMHHIKHVRNGGEDKPRNCVTLCKPHHKRFNTGKAIKFANNDNLPNHIRGCTFQLHQGIEKEKNPEKFVCPKVKKKQMKTYRKTLK